MELFRTRDFYIFVSGNHSLWCDRDKGTFIPKNAWAIAEADNPVCLGKCEGIIGKVTHSSVFEPRLLLIKESIPVGKLHGDNIVYKIKNIAFLPLSLEDVEINLPQCVKHKTIPCKTSSTSLFDIQKNTAFTKTWGTLKNAGSTIKNTTQQAAALATGAPKRRDLKDRDRFEKQIIDELTKIFTDTNSFYYSHTTDLTNSLQRLCHFEKSGLIDETALWKIVDDRYFWNRHMLKDLIELDNPLCNPWILPIIQGYIQIENCKVETGHFFENNIGASEHFEIFTLCILSRRSRFRAGTRYKRRGVNEKGDCANYVETEQLVIYKSHEVSFIQIRGSVPVFWSQPGYKYRPPPRLDKGETETRQAFEQHFNNEIHKYGPICAINLVNQTGNEKVIFDAYSNQILEFNSPFITYVTFDFHEYCRGMHFENVSILMNAIGDIIKEMNYCWRDKQGHICSQNGVFRINCIDCLDRTNVVQTAIGKAVMELQFCKLGLITPEGVMPNNIKNIFQLLWANNGDIISKQYAGTNALKGDYTRTGERKFTGIMKDGMNSANRYYLSHFKDSVRQCCLDIIQGEDLSDFELRDFWAYLRTVGKIVGDILPAEIPTLAPHLALQQEYALANALYHMSRYYLSRFKDSTRQGTIDLMLGNNVSEDIFNESKATQFEEDNLATAEHVKLLIEDCKKMLINQPENVVGAWGLINADPSIGDPSETEIDSVVILTRGSYFVADYDDQVDKITKYQEVFLKDVTLIECGMPELAKSLFSSTKSRFSIRINYKVEGTGGYYHMFRAANFGFFNNMAVFIKTAEEEVETLKVVCETFLVALDICHLPQVPYHQGLALDRRRSKIVSGTSSGSIYLDIVGLPQMTRNVSESQLLAIKSVGSKAISNVTLQFSKLNKIGNSFKQSKSKGRPNFTIGKSTKHETSSDSEDDYETSIFQPNVGHAASSLRYATDTSSSEGHVFVEPGLEVTEESSLVNSNVSDTFLPGVGIVMGKKGEAPLENRVTLEQKDNLLTREDSANVDNIQLSSIMDNVFIQNPEIQVNSEDVANGDFRTKPTSLKLDRKLSHSSGEIDQEAKNDPISDSPHVVRLEKRSVSDYEMSSNISQSQSESALKNKLATIASPVSYVTKDAMFSPFSKLAKGVQHLGANLDPRKLGQVRHVSEKDLEEHRKLQEKWKDCKTRLIAL